MRQIAPQKVTQALKSITFTDEINRVHEAASLGFALVVRAGDRIWAPFHGKDGKQTWHGFQKFSMEREFLSLVSDAPEWQPPSLEAKAA
jgi:hypothetical protein